MTEIDRTRPIPLYYQLKMMIEKQIEDGELRPGDKVPTEEELCEQYDISRTPVRQALLELVNEGLLTRRAGMGTFIAVHGEPKQVLRVVVSDIRWQWPLEEAVRLLKSEGNALNLDLQFECVPLDELHQWLSTSVAHGQAPDISVLDSVWVAEFADRQYLYPLSELDPDWVGEVKNDLYPSLLAANSFDGELFAVPTNADASLIWYRRDWLSAENILPPKTWGDILAIGRHFSQPEIRDRYGSGPYPLAMVAGQAGYETTTYLVLPFLWSMGGDMIADGKVVINSAANLQALTFLKSLIFSEKLVSPDVVKLPADGALRAFAQGESVLSLGGSYENYLIRSIAHWEMPEFLERTGFVTYPIDSNGSTATLVGGMTYGIYRQSRFPKEAVTILKRMLTPEILKPFCLQIGDNATRKTVAKAFGSEDDGFLRRTSYLLEKARSRPSFPTYDQVSLEFQKMMEDCLSKSSSIEDTLSRAAERISAITGFPIA